MNILHYTIGLPPERRGGSVQYAVDLIREQSKTENVFVLTCGDTLCRGKRATIKNKGLLEKIPVYVLTNPLTPTLIYGTSEPASQHRNIDIDYNNIRCFIEKNEIQILHIHTLMGLHSKIVEFIKSLGVKIIYTSHDFHGLCPHYNLINHTGELCETVDPIKCVECNLREPSDRFLRIANSSLYHTLKRAGLFNFLKSPKVRINKGSGNDLSEIDISDKKIKEYEDLILYYKKYFRLIDTFHFNSSQTRDIFKQLLPDIDGLVIPVITSGIKDHRKKVDVGKDVRLCFVGSLNSYKGFPLLKKVLMDLYEEGYKNFSVKAYPGSIVGKDSICPWIEYKPPYDYSQISDIMYGADCVVIPSKWYETFSLVALEALAHGRPVIVSDHVGAKDIVRKYNEDMIFSTPEDLKDLLKSILNDTASLTRYSEKICQGEWIYSIESHNKEILSLYRM